MSYLKPGDGNGGAKADSDYTSEERAHIAQQIIDCQRTNLHYKTAPVDRDALLKAKAFAAEAGAADVMKDIDALLAAVPSRKSA